MPELLLLAADASPAADTSLIAFAANLVVLLIGLAVSAAFSGSESVLFSLTPAMLQQDRQSGQPLRRLAAALMARPKNTLMVILLGNTAANIFLFAFSGKFAEGLDGLLGVWAPLASAVFSVAVVTIGGEVLPKIVGVRFSTRLAPYSALLVQTTAYVLGPVARVIDAAIVAPLTRLLLGNARGESQHDLSVDELKTLLAMSRRGGVINRTENDFLRAVLDLNSLRVVDVMTPRVEVTSFDVNGSSEQLRELMRQTRRKRVPVYDRTIDNIIGLVYAKILFLQPHKTLREIVMPVRFVPQAITCEQLLHHFRSTKTQIAVAVDEFGGMSGIVALEDVLEGIVGDIHDARDAPQAAEVEQISPHEYDVSGRLSVHYWAESFNLPRLADRVSTVGGLVAARLGRPARVGDVVRVGNVDLAVTQTKRRQVSRVRLRLRQEAAT